MTNLNEVKLVIAGVGGQGTILASSIIALSAIKAGKSVVVGETYGAAQRGGPVMGHVQIGKDIRGPVISPGEADVLLGFEKAESVRRSVSFLKNDGLVIMNDRKFPPAEVISGLVEYPSEDFLVSTLKKVTNNIIAFDATSIAKEAGDAIATNMVLIGALCATKILPFEEKYILETISESIRPEYNVINFKAIKLGKEEYYRKIQTK